MSLDKEDVKMKGWEIERRIYEEENYRKLMK